MTSPFSYWKNECSEAKIKAAHTLGQISCLTRENINKAGTVKAHTPGKTLLLAFGEGSKDSAHLPWPSVSKLLTAGTLSM